MPDAIQRVRDEARRIVVGELGPHLSDRTRELLREALARAEAREYCRACNAKRAKLEGVG